MKHFEEFSFSHDACQRELDAFKKLLDSKDHLHERDDILPFFRKNSHLAVLVGSFNPNICSFDRLATEFSLFGDYTCDLVVGDSVSSNFCFVEFEDASPTSIFVKKKGKSTREWSPRFEHGFSQILDWFDVLEDQQKSNLHKSKFGADVIQYVGLLVIGRRNGLDGHDYARLIRRSERLRVGARTVHCMTFDDLHDTLQRKLRILGG